MEGDLVAVARADTLQRVTRVEAPGADAVAVSAAWVAWRAGDRLLARAVEGGKAIAVDTGGVGRPALDGARLVYHQATREGSKLHALDLATGVRTVLASARRALLLNPTTLGGALLYVRSTRSRQELRLRTGATERVLYSLEPTARRDIGREPGKRPHRRRGRVPRQPPRPLAGVTETLWTTALTDRVAYVTRLRALPGTRPSATLLRVRR